MTDPVDAWDEAKVRSGGTVANRVSGVIPRYLIDAGDILKAEVLRLREGPTEEDLSIAHLENERLRAEVVVLREALAELIEWWDDDTRADENPWIAARAALVPPNTQETGTPR